MTASENTMEQRQRDLADRLGSGSPLDMEEGTLIVVPSLSLREDELSKITGIQYYEERLLFMLLQLASPKLRVVFVTSLRVEEPIVDYYLSFIPSDTAPGERLYLVALWDQTSRPLTEKLLERDEALDRLQALADGPSCLLTFNVTQLERDLADRIDVALYGCPPDLVTLGSKSGSRRVARDAGVQILEGSEDLMSVEEVEAALLRLKEVRPSAYSAVIKLNESFSGQGNAIIELEDMRHPLTDSPITFCADGEDWESYARKIAEGGAIVEEHLRGPGVYSPSVQMRIAPDGSYEIVSTHDQILGGPDDQVYLGCRFPSNINHRQYIQTAGGKIAKALADEGVMGSFGVDFVVAPDPSNPEHLDIYLSEINLRMGGTTHPFLMARLVTNGTYDQESGELIVDGVPKCYVATDNFKSESYIGLLPEEVIAAFDRAGLGFDRKTNTGVTLHLLGPLKRFGKLGAVCIADSHAEADELYAGVLAELDALAEAKAQNAAD